MLQEHLMYYSEQRFIKQNKDIVQVWSEANSGDDWWEMQVCLYSFQTFQIIISI